MPRFEKGNKAAVGHGRPKLTDKERAVREALRSEIADVAHLLTVSKKEALLEINKEKSTLLHQMLASSLKSKDHNSIESIFISRMLGSNKQVVEQKNTDTSLVDLSKLSDKELEQFEKLSAKISVDSD